jgi:hypothetical protein
LSDPWYLSGRDLRADKLGGLGGMIGRSNILGRIGNEVLGMKGNVSAISEDALNELTIAGADISRCC